MEVSKIKVDTAFNECADKCPEFELIADRAYGDNTLYATNFRCAHCEKCELIDKKFKRGI